MDGGDRAGYMQIAGVCDGVIIKTSLGKCSATAPYWGDIVVVSSKAVFKTLTAPGLINASNVTTDDSFALGTRISCSKITMIWLSTKCTAGRVIAHNRILI